MTMCRLSRTQRHHQKGSIPLTFDRRGPRSTPRCKVLHETRHQRCIPQYMNKRRRRMENNLYHQVRNIRIPGHAFWTVQRTSGIPTMDQPNVTSIRGHMLHRILRPCPHILKDKNRPHKGRPSYPKGN